MFTYRSGGSLWLDCILMLSFVMLGTVDVGVLFILILWKTCGGRKRERKDINRVVVCSGATTNHPSRTPSDLAIVD